jgi:hypothetical protein
MRADRLAMGAIDLFDIHVGGDDIVKGRRVGGGLREVHPKGLQRKLYRHDDGDERT